LNYTLITANGRIMQFYVESVADLYCRLYGGVVFTQQILDESLTFAVEPV
jgi:hypothetical protein